MKHLSKRILIYCAVLFVYTSRMYSFIVKQGTLGNGQPYYYTVSETYVPKTTTTSSTSSTTNTTTYTISKPDVEAMQKAAEEAAQKKAAEEAAKKKTIEEKKVTELEMEEYPTEDPHEIDNPEEKTPDDSSDTDKERIEKERKEEEQRIEEERRREEEQRKEEERQEEERRKEEEKIAEEQRIREEEERKRAEEEALQFAKEEEERIEREKQEAIAQKEREEKEQRARNAENDEASALAKYQDLKRDYEAIVLKMKDVEKMAPGDKLETIREYEKIENEYKTSVSNLKNKSEAMTKAYEQLAKTYAELGYTGDPVNIATGDYQCEYTDFIAQDYLNKFTVKRNLTNKPYRESFGKSWTCSLDSRIVRCAYGTWDGVSEYLQKRVAVINEMEHCFDDYRRIYPDIPSAVLSQCYKETQEFFEPLYDLYNMVEERKATLRKLTEQNKYVTYGMYDGNTNGYEDFIMYLDEDGFDYYFYLDKSDYLWKSVADISATKMYMENRSDGGYIIHFSDGHLKEYSYYGILEKETDSNGNVTLYESTNGRISSITLKTGEKLTVSRNNNGLITSISGAVSGTSVYSYENDYLIEVIDNEGIRVSFSYNDEGYLTHIRKADNGVIQINYELDFWTNLYQCYSVINEDGYEEVFNRNHLEKTMDHYTVDGRHEFYRYNMKNAPVYIEDMYGDVYDFELCDNGLIKTLVKNKQRKTFTYDKKLRPVSVSLDNGSCTRMEYNDFDELTSITDGDGFKKSFEYDDKGNLLAVYISNTLEKQLSYYPTGLVKSITENKVRVEYEYNNSGSVTKETVYTPDGKKTVKKWEFDSQNRPVLFIDEKGFETIRIYEKNKITEIYNNQMKTEYFMDCKNRIDRIITTDLISGISYDKTIFYDFRGNITSVLYNGFTCEEYSYDAYGNLISSIIWEMPLDFSESEFEKLQGIRSDYSYDVKGNVNWEKKGVLNYNDYALSYLIDFKQISTTYNMDGYITVYTNERGYSVEYYYDNYDRLIRIAYADGSSENFTYTKAGRIKTCLDSNYNLSEYIYNSDGSYRILYKACNGTGAEYDYSASGKLLECRTLSGTVFKYEYDCFDRLIKESAPAYTKCLEYDDFNRITSVQIFDNYCDGFNAYGNQNVALEKRIVYDDKNNLVSLMNGDACYEIQIFDAWGRPVEISNAEGRYRYSYDIFGNAVRKDDDYGNTTFYRYDIYGNVKYIKTPEGNEISCERDSLGQVNNLYQNNELISAGIFNQKSNEYFYENEFRDSININFSESGMVQRKWNSRYGNEEYYWSRLDKYQKTSYDDSMSEYEYNYRGNIVKERNPLEKTKEYIYDNSGRVISRINFDGSQDYFSYDDSRNLMKINYATGEKGEITRNSIGLITSIKNEDCNYTYEYNSLGRLIKYSDLNALISIDYFYDDYGRCIEKKSDSFDFVYSFNKNGKIIQLEEAISGFWISFDYDKDGREVLRTYSSGFKQFITYDNKGHIDSIVTKDSSNRICTGEFIGRNQDGRISLVCDECGNWKKIEYDVNRNICRTLYPYSDVMVEYYLKDAVETGLSIKDSHPEGKLEFLTENESSILKSILEKAGVENEVYLKNSLECWEEKFTYTRNGSVETSENSFGKIIYEYDKMNRLLSKSGANSKANGIKYSWDDNGNLISQDSVNSYIKFQYGGVNRPVLITYTDKLTSAESSLAFTYDVLGRRVSETLNYSDSYSYVYDGFSLDVIQCTPVLRNKTAMTNYISSIVQGKRENNSKVVAENPYKWIDSDNYNSNGSVRTIIPEAYSSDEYGKSLENLSDSFVTYTTTESSERETRPYATLYWNSTPAVRFYVDENSSRGIDCETYLWDSFNNTALISDYSGTNTEKSNYDWWGNCFNGNEKFSFSNSSSHIGIPLKLYNLGFRDYSPSMKSFTTEDPLSEGHNWFSYCPGDPVNYQDKNGMEIVPVGLTYLMTDYDKDILLGNSTKDLLYQSGCYVTTMANVAKELQKYGITTNTDYDDPLKINDHKELFVGGDLLRKETMTAITGNQPNDYWTKEVSTTVVLESQLAKIAAVKTQYIVIAVFDLSSVLKCATNHMVILNQNFNKDGYLTSPDDITASSKNDLARINEKKELYAYSLDNLKEIRIIEADSKKCNK